MRILKYLLIAAAAVVAYFYFVKKVKPSGIVDAIKAVVTPGAGNTDPLVRPSQDSIVAATLLGKQKGAK